MSVKMNHTAKVEMGESGTLTLRHLRAFVDATAEVDGATELVAMMGDKGTQRDPWPFLRGLSITWSTVKPERSS